MEHVLKISQIIFILLKEKNIIVPFKVEHKITEETTNGQTTSYKLSNPLTTEPIDLNDINGQLFIDLEEAKEFMMQRSQISINKIIETARAKCQEWYRQVPTLADKLPQALAQYQQQEETKNQPAPAKKGRPPKPPPVPMQSQAPQEEIIKVELPNGMIGNLKLPTGTS